MKKSALILLTLFYSFTLLLSSTTSSFAATPCPPLPDEACPILDSLFTGQTDGPWYSQNPSQFSKKVLDPTNESDIFGERYTYAQINWIINSIATMLNPAANVHSTEDLINFINLIKTTLHASRPTIQDYAKLGPSGLFVGGISALYSNPPASGVGEIKTLTYKIFDLETGTKPALAQGYGFNSLNTSGAIRSLWTASRDMSYLIMIILLIASGFLIMFRVKINPQTVVSLQTMIPKLIVTLLLVTFSFAIAGLVIDLIYVVVAAVMGFLSMEGIIKSDLPGVINILLNRSFISAYIPLQMLGPILTTLVLAGIITVIGALLGGGLPGAGVGAVIGIILLLIVAIVFLVTLWKIFWMMVKAYVMLTLQIIIAPLQIMLDLVPGQHGFGPWLRNLIANASVFATIPIMLIIQNVLAGDWFANLFLHLKTFKAYGGTGLNLPYMGGETGMFISLALGFVIFTMTPKIADMIRDALKIPPFKYGSAFGEAFGPIKKVGMVGGSIAGQGLDILEAAPPVDPRLAAITGGLQKPKDVARFMGWISKK